MVLRVDKEELSERDFQYKTAGTHLEAWMAGFLTNASAPGTKRALQRQERVSHGIAPPRFLFQELQMTFQNQTVTRCRALYELTSEGWSGCDWHTEFGGLSLNLAGLTASRAQLMARATSGEERRTWEAAAQWLADVETDAARARQAAQSAVELIQQGDRDAARVQIQQAVNLEAKYRSPVTWPPLQAAILAANHSHR